jgi:hypothetical protein
MDEIRIRIHHDRALQLADAMKLCHDDMAAYSSAVALLAVHSAISYNDAVLIRLTGQRSRSQDHRQAIVAIRKACRTRRNIQSDAIKHLDKLLDAKNDVTYGDKNVDSQKIEFLYIAAERFQAWAERVLKN